MVPVLATVFAALAALLHVYIFWMESFAWSRPRVWKRFGVRDQESADTVRPMAYNQGFYNLFLAVGAIIGLILFWVGGEDSGVRAAGTALVLFTLACMVAAALVLLSTGLRYGRAALIQGLLPAIGLVLLLLV